MSNLPEINYSKVSQIQAEKLKESEFQLVQMQVLAETLMEERNEALRELEELKSKKPGDSNV